MCQFMTAYLRLSWAPGIQSTFHIHKDDSMYVGVLRLEFGWYLHLLHLHASLHPYCDIRFVAYTDDPSTVPQMGFLPMGIQYLANISILINEEYIIGILVLWWISVFLVLYTVCIVFYSVFLVAHLRTSRHYLVVSLFAYSRREGSLSC